MSLLAAMPSVLTRKIPDAGCCSFGHSGVQLPHHRRDALVQARARQGGGDAAGCAIEQAHAEARPKLTDRLAQG